MPTVPPSVGVEAVDGAGRVFGRQVAHAAPERPVAAAAQYLLAGRDAGLAALRDRETAAGEPVHDHVEDEIRRRDRGAARGIAFIGQRVLDDLQKRGKLLLLGLELQQVLDQRIVERLRLDIDVERARHAEFVPRRACRLRFDVEGRVLDLDAEEEVVGGAFGDDFVVHHLQELEEDEIVGDGRAVVGDAVLGARRGDQHPRRPSV